MLTALVLAPAAALAQPPPAPAPSDAATVEYKQHMENGIKLFQDRNYGAAIAEFKAAYATRPKASPLLNIALAHKAQFDYPKAIAALETALARHGDTLDPADKAATESAVREMRALLAYARVTVSPPNATLTVDGAELPGEDAGKPIALGPGEHVIGARADGFTPVEQKVSVASRDNVELVITLAKVPAKATPIVPPPPTGEVKPKPPELPPEPPKKRGFYLLGMAGLLFPTRHPQRFPEPQINSGAAGGLRVGFQVNNIAGFDLLGEHASIYTPSKKYTGSDYTLVSNRLAAEVRLMTPGKYVRFVGMIGGGIVYDSVSFEMDARGAEACADPESGKPLCKDATAWNPFLLLEVGAEVDIDSVLIGLALQGIFQSSRGLGIEGFKEDIGATYGNQPLIHLGPGLRVGYRFW